MVSGRDRGHRNRKAAAGAEDEQSELMHCTVGATRRGADMRLRGIVTSAVLYQVCKVAGQERIDVFTGT